MEAKARIAITSCLILATLMQALDTTIANVTLPYMQGSVSASQDEIAWVLTSYIVAAAIMTPPTGFFATRFGIKRVLLVCICGFTITSMLCGAAQSLTQIVVFRCLQGALGAAINPLTQTVMFNINPPERYGRAMSTFSLPIMTAPLLGPVVGGWLTSDYSWRAVFYINVPLGVLAFIGTWVFLPETKVNSNFKLDWLGFGTLSLAIGALQILLDRGAEQDWFSSREIIIECVLAGVAFYLFLVHVFTTRTPFIRPALFTDRNFTASTIFTISLGITTYAALSLQPPYLQELMNEPIVTAGLVMGPRGVGTIFSMLLAGRLLGLVDTRIILFAGLTVSAWAFYAMSRWTPDVSNTSMMLVGLIQGAGQGIIMVPLSTISLSTLAPEHRAEGAGIFNLARTLGSSIGISIVNSLLTYNVQINHAEITNDVTPFNRLLTSSHLTAFWSPYSAGGSAALDAVINRQAQVIAYNDDYVFLTLATLVTVPLLLFIRKPRNLARIMRHSDHE
ncbi:EmrB/QacA family drug resistance transporter [Acidocella aquatica]|uniref:EmrB/QacA family drug resistance transporter n=1 Tax=Acidocella aquatica TaxID=1922313 RepID=A0ABQ6A646_9PROT|nr:DHA2 family efflux MFS transporter permease subunit [Acidocella aquatica]GLR67118.1 EmrB/QacA family drug resistance transporter [Acidocella aquatica]